MGGDEAWAAVFGRSLAGAAYLWDQATNADERGMWAAHLRDARLLGATEAGAGAVADALAAKGQGHNRTWIDAARDVLERDAPALQALNQAIAAGSFYGVAVDAAGGDGAAVGDVCAGLAVCATGEAVGLLEKLAAEARLAGATDLAPRLLGPTRRTLADAATRFDGQLARARRSTADPDGLALPEGVLLAMNAGIAVGDALDARLGGDPGGLAAVLDRELRVGWRRRTHRERAGALSAAADMRLARRQEPGGLADALALIGGRPELAEILPFLR